MPIQFRPATPDDVTAAIPLIYSSGPAAVKYLQIERVLIFAGCVALLFGACAGSVSWKTSAALHLIDQVDVPFKASTVGPTDVNLHLVGDLVSLGNDVVPTLLDALRSPHENLSRADREWKKDQIVGKRDEVVAKALGRLDDSRVVPGLKEILEVNRDKPVPAKGPVIAALLQRDRSEAMHDWVVGYIIHLPPNGNSQSDVLKYLLSDWSSDHRNFDDFSLLTRHIREFTPDAQDTIIRYAARRGDRISLLAFVRDSFKDPPEQNFQYGETALNLLSNVPWPSAGDDLRDLLHAAPGGVNLEILRLMAERKCDDVPDFEALRDRPGIDFSLRSAAAAALCRLDHDYDRNAAIVRLSLAASGTTSPQFSDIQWLHDDETATLLLQRFKQDNASVPYEVLGSVGHVMFLPVLEQALLEAPVIDFEKIGKAMEAIGTRNRLPDAVARGQAAQPVSALPSYVGPHQSMSPPIGDRYSNLRHSLNWLASNPEIALHVLNSMMAIRDPKAPAYSFEWQNLLPLLDIFWQDGMTPLLEREIETNTDETKLADSTNKTHTTHYATCSMLAGFLTYKTGKPVTYVEVDGTVRPGEKWVNRWNEKHEP